MKKIFKITVSILIVIAIGGAFFITRGLKTRVNLVINDVNLSPLNDGIYYGKYNAGRWTNEINITIKDHKIIKLDVVKDVSIPKLEVTNAMINKVIEKQNTN